MKRSLLCISTLLIATCSFAQKISLEKWVERNVDSLNNIGIDTIIYYHDYCGECIVLEKPVNINDTTARKHHCEIDNSWTQLANLIIYKQKGANYTLSFDCSYPPLKSTLKTCTSIPYFLTIVPDLNRRDTLQKAVQKA